MRSGLILAFLVLGVAAPAAAQTPPCAALPADRRPLADSLLATLHPYDCCDDTLSVCLAARPRCILSTRLADDVCRRVGRGQDRVAIERAMAARARTMTPVGPAAAIDLSAAPPAGEPAAPVAVVVYACSTCPFCAVLVPRLYAEVTSGRLAGKARLYLRPFPIKGHEGAREGGLALVAAARMGSFWPYVLRVYAEFGEFGVGRLPVWAGDVGLDRAAFEGQMAAEPTTRDLVESKKEGLRVGVEATPTLFLDGHRYSYDLELDAVVDLVLEAYDRRTGRSTE